MVSYLSTFSTITPKDQIWNRQRGSHPGFWVKIKLPLLNSHAPSSLSPIGALPCTCADVSHLRADAGLRACVAFHRLWILVYRKVFEDGYMLRILTSRTSTREEYPWNGSSKLVRRARLSVVLERLSHPLTQVGDCPTNIMIVALQTDFPQVPKIPSKFSL